MIIIFLLLQLLIKFYFMKMASNLTSLVFEQLDQTGSNYIIWRKDVETYLIGHNQQYVLEPNTPITNQQRALAYEFLRRHIDTNLKLEYGNVNCPKELLRHLDDRFNHQKEVLLPIATTEWNDLRFQDFKKVNEYNAAMFKIISTLQYCGRIVTDADMIEKTLSTFHMSNSVLAATYRLLGYKNYCDLLKQLLLQEKNNEILVKNHNSRPTGSKAFHESNAVSTSYFENGRGRGKGQSRGRGRGYGNGRGRGQGKFYNPGKGRKFVSDKNPDPPQKKQKRNVQGNRKKRYEVICF